MCSRSSRQSLDLPALIVWIFPSVSQPTSIIAHFGFGQDPEYPEGSFRPVRQPKNPPFQRHPPKTLCPLLYRPTPHAIRRCKPGRAQRVQPPLALSPARSSSGRSRYDSLPPDRIILQQHRVRIKPPVRRWVKDDHKEPGSGAGTQRLLTALFPAPHPSRPSLGVRSHQQSLDCRLGQVVVPVSGR